MSDRDVLLVTLRTATDAVNILGAELDSARTLACALEAENAKLIEALEVIQTCTGCTATEEYVALALAPVHDLPGDGAA